MSQPSPTLPLVTRQTLAEVSLAALSSFFWDDTRWAGHKDVAVSLGLRMAAGIHPFATLAFATAVLTFRLASAEPFFSPPDPGSGSGPEVEQKSLAIDGGAAADVQEQIDRARADSGKSILLVRLSGTVTVGDRPLRLASRTCLTFEQGGMITATPTATATSLLAVADAEFVAIGSAGSASGVIDGHGLAISGITIENSGRVNIDRLEIRDCGTTGVSYVGRSAEAVNEAGSLTRCRISNCGGGLKASSTAGFMCLDNQFRGNAGVALAIQSLCSVVAGNDLVGNKTGILSASDHGVIAANTFDDNATTLSLTKAASRNLVTGNRSGDTTGAIVIGGTGNLLFNNDLQSSVKAGSGTKDNLLVQNYRMRPSGNVDPLQVFQPPTAAEPHTRPLIVPGMGRRDLPMPGSKDKNSPTDIAAVQTALDSERAKHPKDVIVLSLTGHYVSRSPDGLKLPANTCVLLDGTIRADPGLPRNPAYDAKAPLTQVVQLPKDGCASFSGGLLDADQQVFHGINATRGGVALIDGVAVRGAAFDGISTRGRGGRPLFIRGCRIADSGGRGIWIHVANNVHAIENICLDNGLDGIDIDAVGHDCTALFNVCSGNHRHGVFVEEAVRHDVVFGNRLERNRVAGIHVWNEAVGGNTGPNVIAANLCLQNGRGIGLGGRASDKTAHDNLFFNNLCADNRDRNIGDGTKHAERNYFTQFVLRGGDPAADWHQPTNVYFTAPHSAGVR